MGLAAKLIQMPVANGSRQLVRFPQKNEMMLRRERPLLLETRSKSSLDSFALIHLRGRQLIQAGLNNFDKLFAAQPIYR